MYPTTESTTNRTIATDRDMAAEMLMPLQECIPRELEEATRSLFITC